jgi:hypothetical protein
MAVTRPQLSASYSETVSVCVCEQQQVQEKYKETEHVRSAFLFIQA